MVWDTDNSITKIEFYANGKKIGEDSGIPYSLNWKAGAGRYTVIARSYDHGKTIDSDSIIIHVR
jgi:hypothetical protein